MALNNIVVIVSNLMLLTLQKLLSALNMHPFFFQKNFLVLCQIQDVVLLNFVAI